MRLWSLDFQYLDTKGLVALWRESLLARAVLQGKTIGYKKHPQIDRFKKSKYPIDMINNYLLYVHDEAERRGFNFDSSKLESSSFSYKPPINVTNQQLKYELLHLYNKIKIRSKDINLINKVRNVINNSNNLKCLPLFNIIEGDIEYWEKRSKNI